MASEGDRPASAPALEDSASEHWRSEKSETYEYASPPPEAEALTADGELHMLTLREGSGEDPPKHARCLVHYVGRLAETGEVFMDTRKESQAQEPEEIVAGRASAYREVGLNLAVARMRRGGMARVWVGPQYGYGQQGSFSFPTVPPAATLVYELELLDFEAPDDEGDEPPRVGMLFEQRLEAAERRRLAGNALFKEGRLREALSKYRLALSYLNEDLLIQLDDRHMAQAQDVRRPTLLNIAAVQLREEDYHAAIATCGEVLQEDPGNVKALFRRGRARAALGQTQDAAADLERARTAAPDGAGISRELAAVRRAMREEREAQGSLFKGFFDNEKARADALYEEPNSSGGGLRPAGGGQGGAEQAGQGQQRSPLARLSAYAGMAVVVAGVAHLFSHHAVGWLRALLGR